jgi:head-tail adaptor
MSFASLLNNSFVVTRITRTSDGAGGWTVGYTAVGTYEGRIRPASGQEREVAAAIERQISHVLYLECEDIERGDVVTCGDLSVEVMGIREPSQAGHHLEIDCLERQREVSA